uniref:F-box associated domain-containing protein n=1 Tax=Aegilops tauschii TaxID=37682 RepID=M8D5I2_AEGTA
MQRYGSVSSYAVSRIKPEEHLFYRSTTEARAAAKSKFIWSGHHQPWRHHGWRTSRGCLRPGSDSNGPSQTTKNWVFLPFYERSIAIGGASKILCVDAEGHTVLYDMDAGSLQPIPCLNSPKGSRPIGFSATNAEASDPERADVFYVMGRYRVSRNPCNFEALMYSDPSNGGRLKGWHWHRLPPPPASDDNYNVICHALLAIDGHSILVVSSGQQSYCFNTTSRKWFKAASWTLPFFRRAVHVPELDNLLFGIDNDEHHFCAMDISPLRSDTGPPLVYS